MNRINIIGLGPAGEKFLTLEAMESLKAADTLYVRTLKHPVLTKELLKNKNVISFDSYYEKYNTFEEINSAIASEIKNKSLENEIYYAVPGNPMIYDLSVESIYNKVNNEEKKNIKIIFGSSVHELALTSINANSLNNLVISNAVEIKSDYWDFEKDNIIIGVYNKYIVSDLKVLLMNYYSEDHMVTYIYHKGLLDEKVKEVKLSEMDFMEDYDHLTCFFIPKNKKRRSFGEFLEIMNFLRSDEGCSWDRKQTPESLIPHTIEEMYELIHAIETKDLEAFEEELGDLLLQVIFYAQINSEQGYFTIHDVIHGIVEKLIRRHPHLFEKNNSKKWEDIKKEEYEEVYTYESILRDLKSLPPLLAAFKIQEKASNVGFDWDNISGAIEKLKEEVIELEEVISSEMSNDRLIDEFGDILFSLVNVSRYIEINPSEALRKSNKKFYRRFKKMEVNISKKHMEISDLSIESLENLWKEAKKEKKA